MLSPVEVTLTARHCLHMREVDPSGWLAKRDEEALIDTADVLLRIGLPLYGNPIHGYTPDGWCLGKYDSSYARGNLWAFEDHEIAAIEALEPGQSVQTGMVKWTRALVP